MTANRNRIMGSRQRASLVTDSALAQRLQVSGGWFVSGSTRARWPLPRCARRASFLFESSEVEQWVKTGVWPAGAVPLAPQREEEDGLWLG